MAVSLSSTHPLVCASFLGATQQPSNSHKNPFLPFNSTSKSYHLSPLSISVKNSYHPPLLSRNGCAFKCSFSAQDEFTHNMDEGNQDRLEEEETGAKKRWESVETLTRFYKEAVLAGDYHTVAEMETAFYRLEAEKNELAEKVSSLSEEITSGKEKYIRLQADFDNFRKRSEKERSSVRSNAQGEVIESLLSMVDSFEKAKQQIQPETDREKKIDTSYQGIYKQFVEIMRSLRVAAVATVGKPFDPSVHEAISREESEEFKEGIVIQEFRRGFLLGDRLLRPAMVKVSSGPAKKKDSAATQKSTEQATLSSSTEEKPAAAAVVEEH